MLNLLNVTMSLCHCHFLCLIKFCSMNEKKLAQLKTGSQHFDEKYGPAMQLSTFMLIANALGLRFSLVVG